MARIFMTDDEKRYAFASHSRGHSYAEIQQMMDKRFGRMPSQSAIGNVVRATRAAAGLGSATTTFPGAVRLRVVEMARSGRYRTSVDIQSALRLDLDRVPCREVICQWLRVAGVYIESRRNGGKVPYSERAVELLLRLYADGVDLDTIQAQVAGVLGKRPSRAWCYKTLRLRGVRRQYQGKKAMRAVSAPEGSEPSAGDLPFLTRDWQEDEQITARLIRRDGCMLAKRRAAREQARRVAA